MSNTILADAVRQFIADHKHGTRCEENLKENLRALGEKIP